MEPFGDQRQIILQLSFHIVIVKIKLWIGAGLSSGGVAGDLMDEWKF